MSVQVLSSYIKISDLYYQSVCDHSAVCPWLFQPKPKSPCAFSLTYCIYQTDQDQLKKPSVIRLPKRWSSINRFSILKLAHWYHFSAMFIEVNLGSPMRDAFFFYWLWSVLFKPTIKGEKVHGLFGLGWNKQGHTVWWNATSNFDLSIYWEYCWLSGPMFLDPHFCLY